MAGNDGKSTFRPRHNSQYANAQAHRREHEGGLVPAVTPAATPLVPTGFQERRWRQPILRPFLTRTSQHAGYRVSGHRRCEYIIPAAGGPVDATATPDAIAVVASFDAVTTQAGSTVIPDTIAVPVTMDLVSAGDEATPYITATLFTGTNGDPWPSPWTTNGGTNTIQSNWGRLAPGASGYAYSRAHTTGLAIADLRLTGEFRINTLSEQYPAISVRHNGAWSAGVADDAILLYIDVLGNAVDIQVFDAGANIGSVGSGASITWVANTRYRFTIEVIEGSGVTYCRAKVWAATAFALEPATWSIDGSTSLAGRPTSGGVGAAIVTGFSDATSYIEFDDLLIQDLDNGRQQVLAIGDSITAGAYNHPDYPSVSTWRKYVYDAKNVSATPLSFVGQNWSCGVADGSGVLGGYTGTGDWDLDHHARNSWTVTQAAATADDDITNYDPDVVILYIGLNDLLAADSGATVSGRVNTLIDDLRAIKSTLKFVLCQIAPSTAVATVPAFNAALAAMAALETSPTSPIVLADCETGFNSGWLYDTIHFTDDGDQFVADQIIAALTALDSGDVTATPAALAATVSIDAVTATAGSTTVPDTIVATTTIDATTATRSETGAPATIITTASIDATTASAGSTVTPATIATTVTIDAVTVNAGSTVTPAEIVALVSMDAVTASGTGSATASPDTIIAIAAIDATTVTADSTVAPATIIVPVAIDAVTASGTGSATASPEAIIVAAALDAVTVQAGSTLTVAAITALASFDAVAASGGSTASPNTIAVVVTLDAVTKTASSTATPTTLEVVAVIPAVFAEATGAVVSGSIVVVVRSEDRTVTVAADQRTVTVAAHDRTVTIPADDRTLTIRADNRTLGVPDE